MTTQLAGHSLPMKGREGLETENVLSILENSLGGTQGCFYWVYFLGYFLVFKKERVQHTQVGELESTGEQRARYYTA